MRLAAGTMINPVIRRLVAVKKTLRPWNVQGGASVGVCAVCKLV